MVFENFQEKVIEALTIVHSNLWYVACFSDRTIGNCMVKSNSVRLQSALKKVISQVILDTNQVIHHIGVNFEPMHMAAFKDSFLFTTSSDSQMFYNSFDEVHTFGGGDERSSWDGTALYSRFYTPTEIAVCDSSNF